MEQDAHGLAFGNTVFNQVRLAVQVKALDFTVFGVFDRQA